MQEFTAEEVAKHNSRESAWVIIHKKVYDVTNFLNEHPGGDILLLGWSGMDATTEFDGQEHSKDAKEILREKLIGRLKAE
jgi:cytochrome-b5 reductase